jgi:alkyl hydroperoxide reductase subunit AhpC
METIAVTTARVGEKAPDFEGEALFEGKFKQVQLGDYHGQWVVLFFWPLDFTFVCPTEIRAFQEKLAEFQERNAQVIGCSVDSVHSHKAWVERDLKQIDFPMIGDLDKKVSSAYGVLNAKGMALRGTFIIDEEGILQSVAINNLDVGRNVEETLRLLDAFKTGGLCPVNWKAGEKTLVRK